MEMDGDLPKRRPKSLGQGIACLPLKAQVRNTFDFANVVRGQALVADILGSPERTANNIESAMGWVRPRTGSDECGFEGGTTNLRVIDRARSGEQPLSEEKLDHLEVRHPSVRLKRALLLWPLLRNGELPPDKAGRAEHFLTDQSFWIIRYPLVSFLRGRECTFPIDRSNITANALTRLTLLGTLDGLISLWLLLRDALDTEEDALHALRIASHIPPTIALYACGSVTCSRAAVLILARMRQLILDQIEAYGRVLDLKSYDLAAASDSAAHWASVARPYAEANAKNAGKEVPVCDELKSWVERWIAPIRSVDEHGAAACWLDGLGPAAYLRATDCRTFPLHSRAIAMLKGTLKDYW